MTLENELKKLLADREAGYPAWGEGSKAWAEQRIAQLQAQLNPASSEPAPWKPNGPSPETRPASAFESSRVAPSKPAAVERKLLRLPPALAFVLAVILPLGVAVALFVFLGRVPFSRGGAGFEEWKG